MEFLILGFIYFLPWVVAGCRHHHNVTAICILNLFLGWSIIGWIIALVWACTVVRKPQGPIMIRVSGEGRIIEAVSDRIINPQ